MLFTDGSVNTQSNIGYGAYLAVSERGLSLNSVRTSVKVRRFEHTSSTKLELQTLLWALNDIQALGRKVILYTDSQNILGLQGRRERFEQNDYRSKKNKRLSNYELYQEFYRVIIWIVNWLKSVDIRYRIKKMILVSFLHLWIELQGRR